jgi:N-acetylmuramoyl-L-alanine amidase
MLGTIPSIKKQYIPEDNMNRPGYKLEATTLTIHNTTDPKSTAQDERDWLVNPSNDRTASWHYCVDEKEAITAIPETEIAWHAGNRDGNFTSLSLKVCVSGDQNIVWKNAVGLAANILIEKGWGVDKLKKHQDWTGKYCPILIIPKWDKFVADVQETINHLKRSVL